MGASVILFDPIFQGLAVALIGGEVAATVLSRVAVPVLYYLMRRKDGLAVEPGGPGDLRESPAVPGAAPDPIEPQVFAEST